MSRTVTMPSKVTVTSGMLCEYRTEVPASLDEALDSAWLGKVLSHLSGGSAIETLEVQGVVKAMASKVRLAVSFAKEPQRVYPLCVKGFLDFDLGAAADITTLREGGFYAAIAPHVDMLLPPCVAVVRDKADRRCIIILADLIEAGAHFYNALEPFGIEQVTETLDQLARLHAKPKLVDHNDWLPSRLSDLATRKPVYPWQKIQQLMRDSRAEGLPPSTTSADKLKLGLMALEQRLSQQAVTLLHGDCHPGNVFKMPSGRLGFTDWQLVQKGHWSLDVAYHIAASMPVELAEKEEKELLRFYLDALQRHGGQSVSMDLAWEVYRCAPIYGFYHWAITQRVDPAITQQAYGRLGAAVTRHESYQRLGI